MIDKLMAVTNFSPLLLYTKNSKTSKSFFLNSPMTLTVAAFYKFVRLPDFRELKSLLLQFCQEKALKGTIILAPEGINGTIVGTRQGIEAVVDYLRSDARLTDLVLRESQTDNFPFERLKVRLKSEIVTLGMPEVDPSQTVGTYINPSDWNPLISDPDVLLLDTRNAYEVDIGTFQKAINPQTDSFREFPDYVLKNLNPAKHQKIAMFCTGGIRCEKASAYLISQGFEQVYQLKGGILNYLAEIAVDKSLWQGECFVFDERVAIKHGLAAGNHEMCLGCGHPITQEDKLSSEYEKGVSCPYCFAGLTVEKQARQREKQRQSELKRS